MLITLLCATACAAPAQPVADACAKVYDVAEKLGERQDDLAGREAYATYVAANPTCFDADLVAKAEYAIAHARQAEARQAWLDSLYD